MRYAKHERKDRLVLAKQHAACMHNSVRQDQAFTYQHVQEQTCYSTMQVMDFGYPQFTEAKILSEYIKTDAHKMEVRACYLLGRCC